MPAPRRAILSDISEFELDIKKKLVVDKSGRLTNPKKDSQEEKTVSPPALEVKPQVQSLSVLKSQEISFVVESPEEPSVTELENSVVEPLPTPTVETVELVKPRGRTGRFKKKESGSA